MESAYSPIPDVSCVSFQVNVGEDGRSPRQFFVSLRRTLTIDTSSVRRWLERAGGSLDPEIIQALNIIIDSPLATQFAAVNRSYYARDGNFESLGCGKILGTGMYTSTIGTEWGPLLTVDEAHTAFYLKKNLVEYVKEFLPRGQTVDRELHRNVSSTLSRDLRGVAVRLRHSKRRRSVKISGLTEQAANRIQFRLGDEKLTNVAAYFQERYEIRLRYPHLPCVRVLRANGAKEDFYPLEVCDIEDLQAFRRKLDPMQTSKMIRSCQTQPQQRLRNAAADAEKIKKHLRPAEQQFGININTQPIEAIGRVITAPVIRVNNRTVLVRDGQWKLERNVGVFAGAEINRWCVVDCAGMGPDRGRGWAEQMRKAATGMTLKNVKPCSGIINASRMYPGQFLEEVKKLKGSQSEPILAVVVLGREPIYAQVKYLTEIDSKFAGIITACVKEETVNKRFPDQVATNMMKKINTKLGGINNVMNESPRLFQNKDFIVIAADVNHPGVGDSTTPSIAAIVGSLDHHPYQYRTVLRAQRSESNNRVEYIMDFKNVALELLQKHREATGKMPNRIFYFRDGVSHGQFNEVRLREIGALREACRQIGWGKYQPAMTVIVAQKRHHTRFGHMEGNGPLKNPPAGTYIDTGVVHPEGFDFYMYTQHGRLGTSRPTRYQVIHDDKPYVTTDDLTAVIFHLSLLCARTFSSISIPAPIYCAHLAAFRAKEYFKGVSAVAENDRQSTSSRGDPGLGSLDNYQAALNVNPNLRNLQYYT